MIHLLRRLFLLKKLYTVKSKFTLFFDFLLIGLLVYLIITDGRFDYRLGVLLVGAYCYAFIRELLKWYIVRTRMRGLQALETIPASAGSFALSATTYEIRDVSRSRPLRQSDYGKLYDIEFDFYRRTRYGTYLSKQCFYTVFEGTLMRPVPHILFDNKRAKGQQFKYLFLRKQRLSLEGDFDRYYTVYVPDHYQIDTLSFITPEVMEQLKAADGCDVELVGDRLFVYAPLTDMADLHRLETTGQKLLAAINDNIDNYADSYVAGPERRSITHPYARQLQKSPLKPALALSAGLMVLAVLLYVEINEPSNLLLSNPALYLYVFVGTFATRTAKVVMDNKKIERQFDKTKQYHALALQPNPYRRRRLRNNLP